MNGDGPTSDAASYVWNDLGRPILDTLNRWLESALSHAPNVLLALLVAVGFYHLGRLVRAVARRVLARVGVAPTALSVLTRTAQGLTLLAGVVVCLTILELSRAVSSLLAGAGVVGLALGFAFQDIFANYISGLGLSIRHPFVQGDIIESNGFLGVADLIELRTTTLRTFDGKRVRIPNRKLFGDVLVNHTDNDLKRVAVECGVHYDTNLERAADVAVEALNRLDCRSEEREAEVFFRGFGASSIDFEARIWIAYATQGDLTSAKDQMVRVIKRAFDENGIVIPFPIRTIELPQGVLDRAEARGEEDAA